jgi:hypothetical protein
MSYTYLQEREAGFWEESCSDTPQFALWKLNLTAEKFYCNASETEFCQNSQSGTTLKLLTENLGEEKLTLCAGDSPARTLAAREMATDSTAPEADCGKKCGEWFAKFDPNSCSWKTRQCSLFEDWGKFSVTWPRWGMMSRGECFPLPMLEHDTSVKESGSWDTPVCHDWKVGKNGQGLGAECQRRFGARPHPNFSEGLMGWPISWSELKPLETDKFQEWLRLHGKSFQKNNHLTY